MKIVMQVANVHKVLGSVSEMTDNDNLVVVGKTGGYIVGPDMNEQIMNVIEEPKSSKVKLHRKERSVCI